ncbi:hypothetical protein [Enhygromyxa salina]|uniref:Lipoprotein n=1 Tax=Enhygromyxa salina TaxID=215803 RepID=A0A2S9XPH6_9BACT|nr:hypothetical protein [Enhygromyxa salina]PRP94591.1 hypothetical protein ENSA7_77600 [Enhygromyxa salina]
MHRFGPTLLIGTLLSCATPAPSGAPSTEPDVVPSPAVESPALPSLTQACTGTQLDLKWMAEDTSRCASPLDSYLEPDPRLRERLEPAELQLTPDASAEIDYVISNPTDEPLTFDLPALACSADLQLLVRDAGGERLNQDCVAGGSCSMPNARVTLEPGGDARFRLAVRSAGQSQYWSDDGSCALHPPEPLSPGTYALEPDSGLFDYATDLRGSMTVVAQP